MAPHSSILAWRTPCREAWWATAHGVAKSQTWLSTNTVTVCLYHARQNWILRVWWGVQRVGRQKIITSYYQSLSWLWRLKKTGCHKKKKWGYLLWNEKSMKISLEEWHWSCALNEEQEWEGTHVGRRKSIYGGGESGRSRRHHGTQAG